MPAGWKKTNGPSQKGEDSAYLGLMKRTWLWSLACLGILGMVQMRAVGQTDRDLTETCVRSPHIGLVFGVMSPQGDWAQRYANFGEMGLMAGLKTERNGYVYLKASSWSGADVNEPGLLSDLMGPDGQIIDNEGDVAQITVTGRGGQFGLGVGKIFGSPPNNPNSGWMVKLGAGSLHHNIHFDYFENRIGPLEDDRVKGYDRMRWGGYGEAFAGYWLMSPNQRINAVVGILGGVAQTASLRSVNFDTLEANPERVWEGWFGLEAGWVFHIYKRASKEYWY